MQFGPVSASMPVKDFLDKVGEQKDKAVPQAEIQVEKVMAAYHNTVAKVKKPSQD